MAAKEAVEKMKIFYMNRKFFNLRESYIIILVAIFIIYKLGLVSLGYISNSVIPDNDLQIAHYPIDTHSLLYPWVKWDSVWYMDLIKNGYGGKSLTAFFPLYPLVVKTVSLLAFNISPEMVGLFLSSLFLFLSLMLIYKLTSLDFDRNIALNSVIFFLLFPCSLFFNLIYAESLLLLLTLLSIYLARTNKWFLAGLCGLLASLTKPEGVIILIPLIVELFILIKIDKKYYKNLAYLILIPAGLLIYMLYLKYNFDDPFLFLKAQQEWGRFSGNVFTNLVASFSLIKGIFFAGVLLSSYLVFKYVRKSYGIYALSMLLIPLMSGNFISLNRHTSVIFPIFILLAYINNKYEIFGSAVKFIFTLFLSYFIVLYVNGYWVG